MAVSLAAASLSTGTSVQMYAADSFAVEASDTGNAAYRYFYDQLTPEAKVFYDAMYEMYEQGLLKMGNADFELTANGYFTQEQAAAYAGGGGNVLALFGAARDAFYVDYPDIFYVDFSNLSIRVTQADDESFRVYIGTGRYDNYYAEGFTGAEQVSEAIAEYEAVADKIAAEAENITVDEGESLQAEQVKFVHDYITHHTSYRLENACAPENIGLIRTSYGSLVRGEAVCEGYSRAFKSILDRLDIPCVLVNGVYRHTEDILELHMWNDVQVDGIWYGTDVTMDDPKTSNPSDNGVDGYENDDLLLVGSTIMYNRHGESGIMSEANFEFAYPELSDNGYGITVMSYTNGLTVRYNKNGEFEDIPAGEFYISYNGMGYAKAAEQGKYMICNMSNYYENTDEWINSGWCYITPELYPALEDSDTELYMPMPHIQYVQFGVTDIPYGTTDYNGYEVPDLFFHGDPFVLEAVTDVLYNPSGNYIAPPYIKTQSPIITGKIQAGKTYRVTATYNDTLIPVEGEEIGLSLSSEYGLTADENSKLENFEWDGDSTVSFDFTPSPMWADDNVLYTISIKGLVGARSHKSPNPIQYVAANPSSYCCMRAYGYNWSVFGKPALIDNTDISTNGWVTSDGEPVDENLKSRMVLVASSPSHAQTDAMNEMIEAESEEKVLKSETYNINLTICKAMVVKPGEGIRVSLGFPEGYGPEDEGVTFKAYHFMKNAAGELTGVEEIPCTITKYGLIILCSSFSPFAIVAVEDNGTKTAEKSVVAVSTKGGSITGAEGIVTLNENESVTMSVEADERYVIESVSVDGKYVDITDSSSMVLVIEYDDISENTCIVDVKFAARSVIEKEAERGETAVQVDSEAEAKIAQLEYKLGDPNNDGFVNSSDATFVLAAYGKLSTGTNDLTDAEYAACDVNKDTKVDSSDATLILAYYAYLSTGGKAPFEEYLADNMLEDVS